MTRRHLCQSLATLALICGSVTGASGAVDNAVTDGASALFVSEHPEAGFFRTPANRLTSVYGPAFSNGATPAESAGFFALRHAGLFGAKPDDLVAGSSMTSSGLSQPMMWDPATGTYKFTLVYYSQYRDSIPVFRADLRLLVRNEEGFPLVLAKSALRDLGAYHVPANWQATALTFKGVQNAIRTAAPDKVGFTNMRPVIWAGYDDQLAAPTLAFEVIADNGPAAKPGYDRRLYLVDAFTGAILFNESQIFDVDVAGTVAGMASQGYAADVCSTEAIAPLPYARVTIGATTAYADAAGVFSIPNAGSGAVSVTSPMIGRYFTVNDQAQSPESLTQTVTPPGPVNFVHNAANTSPLVLAEVNTYIAANQVRDYVLGYIPTYPTVSGQTGFPINVNLSQTCNAYYDGASINFFQSGGGCNNTGFGTVVHHEYGHHLVAMAGSGQGEYGEGMGDVMGVLVTDLSALAVGFQSCSGGLRDANNNCQYITPGCSTCGGEIHACGQLIAGSVWTVRNNLQATNPSTYRSILSNIAINSLLLHQGTAINPQITIDYLTLDDTDANILNGTPHYAEINGGFTSHNLPGPALGPLRISFVGGRPVSVPPTGGVAFTIQVEDLLGTAQPGTGTLWYSTSTFGGGFTQVSMTQISPNVYQGVLPATACGTNISYYVGARTTTNTLVTAPANPPSSVFQLLSAYTTRIAFEDDCETDRGWTMGVPGDTASNGFWTRNDPIGTSAQPEDDHSPEGIRCFFTGQGSIGGTLSEADVDGGITTLVSPAFSLVGYTAPKVSYFRWFSNHIGVATNSNDVLLAQISADNGSSWTTLETVGPNGAGTSGGWVGVRVDVPASVALTSTMKLRFRVNDTGVDNTVEAAIDDVRVFSYTCTTCPSDWNNDGSTSSQDFFDFLAAFFALNADFNHDGATNSQDLFDFLTAFFTPC